MHGTNTGYSVAKVGNSDLKMVERAERGCATKGHERAAEFSTYRLSLSPPNVSLANESDAQGLQCAF